MTDAEDSEITPHVDKFQISSEHICFCDLRYFIAIYALLCGENLAQNVICGEKLQISSMHNTDYLKTQNSKIIC